jgi:hypothetical protein
MINRVLQKDSFLANVRFFDGIMRNQKTDLGFFIKGIINA